MNADGIAGVIGAWSERMIGQHVLQCGDGVARDRRVQAAP